MANCRLCAYAHNLGVFIPVNKDANKLTTYGKKAYYADGNGFHNTNLSILSHFKLIPEVTNADYVKYVLKDPKNFPDSTKYVLY